jgi:predicted nucleic acid-binding protein
MIFVDTGAWVARFSRRDQYQRRAIDLWAKLKESNARIVTSDSVFAETITLVGRKIGAAAAVEAGRFLHYWSALTVLRATREDETAALALLAKFGDQSVGFVDCLSFALMRRHGITTAFTFDRHFELAGFRSLS